MRITVDRADLHPLMFGLLGEDLKGFDAEPTAYAPKAAAPVR